MHNFKDLISTLTPTILTWRYFSDFEKIRNNTFRVKVSLNILNSLLGESDIENKFLELVVEYPKVRKVLPILIAVRNKFGPILDHGTKELLEINYLFDPKIDLDNKGKKEILNFFNISGLRWVFENKDISNLHDYVFGVEVGLDTNARKNRTGKLMEDLVKDFIRNFCNNKGFEYKEQATSKWMKDNWYIDVKSDKSDRRFDFTIFTGFKVYVLETNYYNGGGSKLKSVAGEFSNLYHFLGKQDVKLIWITDGNGWQTALRPLEEAYIEMEGNIYNIEMLRGDILNEIIK